MKRFALVAIAMAALLLAPAGATAGKSAYTGTVTADPAASVQFTIKKKRGKKKIVDPGFTNLEAQCTDEDGQSNPHSARLTTKGEGAARVKNNKFKWRATEPFVRTMKFAGKLKQGGNASGTVEYFGDVEANDGTTMYCETGVVPWTATKN